MLKQFKTYLLSQWAVITIIALSICIVNIVFGFMAIPDHWLFSGFGDGLTNYFYLGYHVKHGTGWLFEGLTYPYQEHLLYTDSALIIYIFNWIDDNIFELTPNLVGYYHNLLIYSFVLGPLFIYGILREYQVEKGFAIPAALLIGFFAPQFMRIYAHYSLIYTFYIPMLWYAILRLLSAAKSWKWAVVISLIITTMSLIHPYYLPLGGLFVLGFTFLYTISQVQQFKKVRTKVFSLGLAALVPFAFIFLFIGLTDPFDDRHAYPYGLFHYTSSLEFVFLPSSGPFRTFLEKFISYTPVNSSEGYAYIGLATILILVFAALRLVKIIWKKRFSKIISLQGAPSLHIVFWVGVLFLILSLALPFIYMEFLLDWIPPLRQFRSLGRFAWVFYYATTIYAAYFLYINYKAFRLRGQQKIGLLLVISVFLFWGLDLAFKLQEIKTNISSWSIKNSFFHHSNNRFNEILQQKGYKTTDFQAIFPLPYLHIGSEKFYLGGDAAVCRYAYSCAYQTGLPIAAAKSARTSLAVTYKQVQMLSGDYIEKEILQDLKSDKPFLVIITPKMLADLTEEEYNLFSKCELIMQDQETILAKLPISAFKPKFEEIKAKFEQNKASLYQKDGVYTTDSLSRFILEHYDNNSSDSSPNTLRGNNCLSFSDDLDSPNNTILYTGKFPKAQANMPLQLSFWMYSNDSHAGFNKVSIEQLSLDGTTILAKTDYEPKNGAYVYKNWICPKVNFTLKDPNSSIVIRLIYPDRAKDIRIDELLIKPQNADIFWNIGKDNAAFVYNNFTIPN